MGFTDAEIDYLAGQPLGRVATAQPNGTLQVSPVGFRYNSRTNTIDIGGHGMARSRKFRNVAAGIGPGAPCGSVRRPALPPAGQARARDRGARMTRPIRGP